MIKELDDTIETMCKDITEGKYDSVIMSGRRNDIDEKDDFGLPFTVFSGYKLENVSEFVTLIRQLIIVGQRSMARDPMTYEELKKDDLLNVNFDYICHWAYHLHRGRCKTPDEFYKSARKYLDDGVKCIPVILVEEKNEDNS